MTPFMSVNENKVLINKLSKGSEMFDTGNHKRLMKEEKDSITSGDEVCVHHLEKLILENCPY